MARPVSMVLVGDRISFLEFDENKEKKALVFLRESKEN